jgi:hypothetical protein
VVESSGTGWCAAEEGALPVDRQRQAREVVVAVAACGDGVSFDGEAPRGADAAARKEGGRIEDGLRWLIWSWMIGSVHPCFFFRCCFNQRG